MTRTWLHLLRTAVLGLPLLAALPAHAQYSWIDARGTRVFSDQPPPPGTPANRILKTPRGVAPASLAAPAAQPAPEAAAEGAEKTGEDKPAKPKGPPTLAEREADYVKRSKERQEAEAKAAEQAAANARECAELRRVERDLAGQPRLTRVNASGEREFVGDAERERLIAQARQAAAKCR